METHTILLIHRMRIRAQREGLHPFVKILKKCPKGYSYSDGDRGLPVNGVSLEVTLDARL
jgi:hypothetical protein